ncbi:malonyl-CoA decarboxylase [Falsihalocynthiibacter sp. SS001]|uniref:malonyl-CoA decarboxylase n=1 Tax=Falsihalocynthiibacter sp. SS001 TaxID=3349698 RepID=UPI0036D369E3
MNAKSPLSDLLTTLLARRPFTRKVEDSRSIITLCEALLSERTENSGLQQAAATLAHYQALEPDEKLNFFKYLNEELDVDPIAISDAAKAYAEDRSVDNYRMLGRAAEARRQNLFRRLNQAPGATSELVQMRSDLLRCAKSDPELKRLDLDLSQLLKSWFNRGFLVLRQITWDSPASILEKIIEYEAVHEIHNWDDLRRRLAPEDRRCFAFFHPSMPDDPLIFVEVALTKGIPGSIQSVLSEERDELSEDEADTAVFYSISNCQTGLAGISFGNSLIKQVVQDLSRDVPNLKTFVTLSPIPGLRKWAEAEGHALDTDDAETLTRHAATYLLDAKAPNGKPLDPVARFHLGNGAIVHKPHPNADTSDNGAKQSYGAMVNYLYDLGKIAQNSATMEAGGAVPATTAVRSLAKQAKALTN